MALKSKTFRKDSWDPNSEITVYLDELDDPSTQRTILVRLSPDGMPIGRIVGEEGRKHTVGGPRNPLRTPKPRMLWNYSQTGRVMDSYTRLDSQAEALRYLVRAHERREEGLTK